MFYRGLGTELECSSARQISTLQEELKAFREAYAATLAALTKTAETNANVTRNLLKAIYTVRNTPMASREGTSQTRQRLGIFTVKPKSIDTFSGEKSIATVYSWLTTVENVFYLRAQECDTEESTNAAGTIRHLVPEGNRQRMG